jgi:crossover junction endodeoxyribonuclease RuvC
MVLMGVDPGYAITGYGILDYSNGKLRVLDYGVVSTKAGTPFEKRMLAIFDGLTQSIEQYRPVSIAIEELFFSRNTTTAIGTAQARGVAVLCGARAGLPVHEYTPRQVKLAVAGYGLAEKRQVQQMVRIILGLTEIPKPDDAADALAIAICHAHSGADPKSLVVGGYQ